MALPIMRAIHYLGEKAFRPKAVVSGRSLAAYGAIAGFSRLDCVRPDGEHHEVVVEIGRPYQAA
jgi:hypothetical protein